ncbi:hypothetical protein HMPREF0983_01689 [Erysipelotrichaceae bacterium 3_1_53]|nr:hypothetical protein HMPREF0983_01689 [Erysipelotrichaceae bacterium 3_1_53]
MHTPWKNQRDYLIFLDIFIDGLKFSFIVLLGYERLMAADYNQNIGVSVRYTD